jgi:hypothetical protein
MIMTTVTIGNLCPVGLRLEEERVLRRSEVT